MDETSAEAAGPKPGQLHMFSVWDFQKVSPQGPDEMTSPQRIQVHALKLIVRKKTQEEAIGALAVSADVAQGKSSRRFLSLVLGF